MTDYAASLPSPTLAVPRVAIRPLLRNVYIWMTVGLVVTALVAWVCSNSATLIRLWANPWIAIGAFILQLILVAALAIKVMDMDPSAATGAFLGYAALTGFTLTGIVLAYELGDIAVAFVSTASLFAVMSLVGMFTKADLTKMGTILIVGVIALLIAMIINIFVGSETFEFVISAAGVVIFTGLVASDTQKISRMASDPRLQGEESTLLKRLSIIGALTLYLDFLNLFLFLLRLLGRRS